MSALGIKPEDIDKVSDIAWCAGVWHDFVMQMVKE